MNSVKEIKYSAIISYFAIIFSILAGLFYTPWMIKQIGRDDFGLYSLVTVFISYFMLDFGLGQVICTYVAKCKAANDFKLLRKIVAICYKAYFLVTCLIAIVLFVVYFLLDDIFMSLTPIQCERFKVIYCIAGFFSVVSFPLMPLNGIIIAYEKLVVLKVTDLIKKLLCIILIIICLIQNMGLYALVAVNSLVGFAISIFKLFYVRKKFKLSIDFKVHLEKGLLKELLGFSGWVFVMCLAERFIIGSAPTILGGVSGANSIAIFSIAMTLEGYVWMFSNAVNGLFIPKVAQYEEAKYSPKEMTDKMIQVGRFQLMAIGCILGGIVCIGGPFIRLWVGDAFKASYWTTLLIVSPQLIIVTQEIGNTLFWVRNRVKSRCLIYCVGTLLSVTLGYLLAPYYGAVGCGIAISIALMTIILTQNIIYSKQFHLEIRRFYTKCHLHIVPFMTIPVLIILAIQIKYPIVSWTSFVAFAAIYIILEACTIFLCLNNSEKRLVLPHFFNVNND